MAYRKPRIEATRTPEGKNKLLQVVCNPKLFNQLIDIKEFRRTTLADTVRLLLYIGIEQWNINDTAGRNTGAKRKADVAQRKAEAQAIQAQRIAEQERKTLAKQGKHKPPTAPAVTPMLYGMTQSRDKEDTEE